MSSKQPVATLRDLQILLRLLRPDALDFRFLML
jgi:hypothetical protein